jgi:hypothetical protein
MVATGIREAEAEARRAVGSHVLGRHGRGSDRGIGDPVPAAGIVLVELGFERDALLAVDLLSNQHGVAEQGRDTDRLLAAWDCVVVAIKFFLWRREHAHELRARVSAAVGVAARGAEAFDDAGHCGGVWDVVQLWSGVVAVEAGCAN